MDKRRRVPRLQNKNLRGLEMKTGRRTFLKLCGTAVVAVLPGVRLFAIRVYNKIRGVKPQFYPGRVKPLNIAKMRKRGEWQG